MSKIRFQKIEKNFNIDVLHENSNSNFLLKMRLLLIFETTVELTYSGHVFWRKLLGFSGVIGNVVIEIMAPRLNRRHVQIICNQNCNKLRQSVNAFLNLFCP